MEILSMARQLFYIGKSEVSFGMKAVARLFRYYKVN